MVNPRRSPLRLNPTQVPTVPVEIDWSHPLARGLVGLYIPGCPSGFLDIAGNLPPANPLVAGQNGLVSDAVGIGFAAQPTTASGGLSTVGTQLPPIDFSLGASMWTFRNRLAVSPSSAWPWDIALWNLASDSRCFTLYSDTGNSNYAAYENATFLGTFSNIGLGIQSNAITFIPSGLTYGYYNGSPYGSLTSQATLGFSPSVHSLYIGTCSNEIIFAGGLFNVPLSANDIAWLNAEPFAMLRPKLLRTRVFLASGGGTNLTASLVAWNWQGQVAGLNAKTEVASNQVPWLWTGQVPGLNSKTDLTSVKQNWNWTGFPAGVDSRTDLAASQTTWAWLGNAAIFTQRNVYPAVQTAWAWIGQVPGLDLKVFLTPPRAAWQWLGRVIPGFRGHTGQGLVRGMVHGLAKRLVRGVVDRMDKTDL